VENAVVGETANDLGTQCRVEPAIAQHFGCDFGSDLDLQLTVRNHVNAIFGLGNAAEREQSKG